MFGLFKKKTAAASSPGRPSGTAGPDFSDVDSQAKVDALFRQGKLEKLFLMPVEFGGQDMPLNVLYVPIGVAAQKSEIDLTVIEPLISQGKVSQYRVSPEYQGNSLIPIALTIKAWNPGEFTTTINVWGEALGRQES